jgi:hypothetical protein
MGHTEDTLAETETPDLLNEKWHLELLFQRTIQGLRDWGHRLRAARTLGEVFDTLI